jgi:hypothetical protein
MLPQTDAPHATLINNWIGINTCKWWLNFTIWLYFIVWTSFYKIVKTKENLFQCQNSLVVGWPDFVFDYETEIVLSVHPSYLSISICSFGLMQKFHTICVARIFNGDCIRDTPTLLLKGLGTTNIKVQINICWILIRNHLIVNAYVKNIIKMC